MCENEFEYMLYLLPGIVGEIIIDHQNDLAVWNAMGLDDLIGVKYVRLELMKLESML